MFVQFKNCFFVLCLQQKKILMYWYVLVLNVLVLYYEKIASCVILM